ncbi:MAG: exonuclease [Myxococcales bacterium]|nr:exonuclease [Myxococcales bacterium]
MPGCADLFSRHAFVDLETTGLDPSKDEVIEVGALFVERGEVVGRLSRLCRASKPLPLAIRRITGIEDADLKAAPPFAELFPTLKSSLAGWTIVAHNAAFEESFLAGLLGEIRAPLLDSCELLHYLYPELESHSLEAVIRWAKVGDHAAHRALLDCEDTFACLCTALGRCIEEGRGDDLEDLLAILSPAGPHSGEPELGSAKPEPLIGLLSGLLELCRKNPPPLELKEPSRNLPAPPGRTRLTPVEKAGASEIADSELESILGPSGELERQAEGSCSRPAELEMARRVARSLEQGKPLAIEAGAGTGKSLAYLTPAALFAARRRVRVAVAPHTKALQDQLVEKDLPRLHRATGGGFGFAVLKGQTNYLCRRRALEATWATPEMPYEERAPRAYLRAFLRRSPSGDLAELSYWFRQRYPALGPLALLARSEAATTLGEKCLHFARCFYHSALAQAAEADLLVINQSLALSWPSRYPKLEHAIFDEAHELEDVATAAFASELTGAGLAQLVDRLAGGDGRRGVLGALRRGAEVETGRKLAAELSGPITALASSAQALATTIGALCSGDAPGDGRGGECRITEQLRQTRPFARAADSLRDVREAISTISRLLGGLFETPSAIGDRPAPAREAAGALAHAQEVAALIDELFSPKPGRCYRASVRSRGRPGEGMEWTLSSEPVEVAPLLQERFSRLRGLVLASATLTTGPDRPWVLERLGLRAAALHCAPSPFRLDQQALVVLVTDSPDPKDEAFLDWAAARISSLALFMGGRVLGLFASSRRLEEVGERVRNSLEPAGILVLRRWRGQGQKLAAPKERDLGSVLLGTRSFWQGVDIPGPGVGCVFIDKLPIEPLSRPIVAAREEPLGRAGFGCYRLPRALILLRQGVGRLIRSRTDRGVVLIAHPGSSAYRRELLAALSGYRVEQLKWSEARARIWQALGQMGLERGSSSTQFALHAPSAHAGRLIRAWP